MWKLYVDMLPGNALLLQTQRPKTKNKTNQAPAFAFDFILVLSCVRHPYIHPVTFRILSMHLISRIADYLRGYG